MTIRQFADATGYSPAYIRRACHDGKIPCELWHGIYMIPDTLVALWRTKRLHRGKRGRTIHNSVTLFQQALDRYNKQHGTCYSYGQAVRLGILE